MKTKEELTVGELVARDYRKAEIFKKHGIDFCCGGKKTVSKVCREKGINQDDLENELHVIEKNPLPISHNFYSWDAAFLADYIINTHHKYVREAIPLLFEFTQKVSRVHGQQHPEVENVAKLFMQVMDEMNRHMMKEENILFPYIKQLSQTKAAGGTVPHSPFGTIQNPVNMMEHEHDAVGSLMNEIRQLTNNYSPPPEACNSYRYSYSKLEEFENDLHQHIHLENNILFPKAITMEKELAK